MAFFKQKLNWFLEEFGLNSIYETGRDAWLIILLRSCRMFAYGTNQLILALFFNALGFSDYRIGLFMTLTLVGDVFLGTLLSMTADKIGRRKVLFGGSFLMVLTGVTFAIFDNFWILLFAAVVGVVSVTGSDFGPFRSIEESILSQLTTPKTRSDVLSWYVTTSALGSAIGSEASGRIIHWLQSKDGWTILDAYHTLFYVYTVMGFLNAALSYCLSAECELQIEQKDEGTYALVADDDTDDDTIVEPPTPSTIKPGFSPRSPLRDNKIVAYFADRFTSISPSSRSIMYKLWFLLGVDSIADGMVPWALTNYYLDNKFHVSKATLGDITSVSYFLASIGTIFAAPLARRIGLINTMVFTHVPSSAAVLLFPAPPSLWLTVILLFIRSGLNNMDQAPRAAFIAAVVKPEERTAIMGLTGNVRTLAATIGPTLTGALAGNDRFWIAFVVAGAFRLAYDFGLWAMFVNMKLHTHEEGKPGASDEPDPRKSREIDEERELEELAN